MKLKPTLPGVPESDAASQKEKVEESAAPRGGRAAGSGRRASHPSTAKPPPGLCRRRSGPGNRSPYLAGFVKLLLEPRHRHLSPAAARGGGAAQAERPTRPLAVSPAPTAPAPRADGNIAFQAGSAAAAPLAAAGAHANDRTLVAGPLAAGGRYANESARRRPRRDVAWRQRRRGTGRGGGSLRAGGTAAAAAAPSQPQGACSSTDRPVSFLAASSLSYF